MKETDRMASCGILQIANRFAAMEKCGIHAKERSAKITICAARTACAAAGERFR